MEGWKIGGDAALPSILPFLINASCFNLTHQICTTIGESVFPLRRSSCDKFCKLFDVSVTGSQKGGDNATTFWRKLVEVGMGNFAQQSMGAQHSKLASHRCCVTTSQQRILGGFVKHSSQITIA